MRILLIFLAAGLFVTCSAPKKENVSRNELPAIPLTLVSGEKLMTSTLEGGTILIFYVPDCDHCQREAEAIRGQLNAFKDYSLYFITASEPDEMNRFAERYGLKGFANVYFAPYLPCSKKSRTSVLIGSAN